MGCRHYDGVYDLPLINTQQASRALEDGERSLRRAGAGWGCGVGPGLSCLVESSPPDKTHAQMCEQETSLYGIPQGSQALFVRKAHLPRSTVMCVQNTYLRPCGQTSSQSLKTLSRCGQAPGWVSGQGAGKEATPSGEGGSPEVAGGKAATSQWPAG